MTTKEFIKQQQGGVLLQDYTLKDMEWFMNNYVKKFINGIDNELYNKIRNSKGDAECRRYLKEHLK